MDRSKLNECLTACETALIAGLFDGFGKEIGTRFVDFVEMVLVDLFGGRGDCQFLKLL